MAVANSWANAAFKARALVQQGTLSETPAWLEIMERFGTFEPKKGKGPKQIEYDEDRLYQAYMAKHPEFLQQPLDLNSEQPPAMKLFVMAQSALMEQGHNRKTAFRMVEEEFRRSAPTAALSAGQMTLTAAQKHEERILQEALKARRDDVGPPPGLDNPPKAPPATQTFSFRLPPRPQPAAQSQEAPQTQQAEPSTSSQQSEASSGNASQQVMPAQNRVQNEAPQTKRRSSKKKRSKGQPNSAGDTLSESGQGLGHSAPAGFVPFGNSEQ